MAIQYRLFPITGSLQGLVGDNVVATLHTSSYAPLLDSHRWVSDLSNELAASGGYGTGGLALTSKTLAYITANTWGQAPATGTAYQAGAMTQTGGHIYRAIAGGTSGGSAPTWPTALGSTVTDGTVTWICQGTGSLAWQAAASVPTGYLIRPPSANGYLYRAAVGGTTDTSAPTWPTITGQSVVDNQVTWECAGTGVHVFACANPTWPSPATFTGTRFVVFSDRTPASTSAQPLVAFIDYGVDQNASGGSFVVELNPAGLLFYYVP